jgi:hypothetical protein
MFIIDFLFWLPTWLLGTVLFASFVGGGLASLWAVRRWLLPWMRVTYEDAEFASGAVQCALLLYGLIAALIAVGVWERHSQVEDIVSSEAASISALWRDLGGYPEPLRSASRDTLRGGTEQIIHDAWPLQAEGKTPSKGVEVMDRLQAQMFAFEPATDSQRILHTEALRGFNTFMQARRQRLDCVQGRLPAVFWLLLLPGGAVCTLILTLFQVGDVRFHALLLAIVAALLAMVLFLIMALDRPFSGAMAVSADSYQLIYDQLMRK